MSSGDTKNADASKVLSPQAFTFSENQASGGARQHNGHNYYNYTYTVRQRRSDETLRDSGRNHAFLAAAKQGQLPRLRYLLHLGADLDFQDDSGSALHAAAFQGLTEVARFLLEAGAEVDCVFDSGTLSSTALTIACDSGHEEIVELLLATGANPNGVAHSRSRSPLHAACSNKHAAIVERLLLSGASPVKASLYPSLRLLGCALVRAEIEDMKLRYISSTYMQQTPLHTAVEQNALLCAQMLLEHEPTCMDVPALCWISDTHEEDFTATGVSELATKISIPTLHLAVSVSSSLEMVSLLLDHGADVNQKSKERWTALHCAACDNKSADYIGALISHGANVEARTDSGLTPLYLTLKNDAAKSLSSFLDTGVDIDTRVPGGENGSFDYYLLHLAAELNSINCTKLLLQRGMDVDTPCDLQEGDMTTPLHIAMWEGSLEVAKYLLEEGNCSVKRLNCLGHRALHIAAYWGLIDIMQPILDRGATVDKEDAWGRTAAFYAAWYGRSASLRFLLDKGAQLNFWATQGGMTLLTRAVYAAHADVLETFLDSGADPSETDYFGWSALSLAETLGDKKICEVLQHRGYKLNVGIAAKQEQVVTIRSAKKSKHGKGMIQRRN